MQLVMGKQPTKPREKRVLKNGIGIYLQLSQGIWPQGTFVPFSL
jgi:hypothetical protein